MSWNDTYRKYVNLPRNQLISMAINAADGIMCVISAAEGSHRTAKRMLAMLFGLGLFSLKDVFLIASIVYSLTEILVVEWECSVVDEEPEHVRGFLGVELQIRIAFN